MSEDNTENEDRPKGEDQHKVGYKSPPRHTRFKKGQSGNPRGRPKGHLNLKTDLTSELGERIKLTQDGKPVKLTKQRALVKTLVARAIKGDPRATNALLPLILKLFDLEPIEDVDEVSLTETDEQIIKAFLARHSMNEGDEK